MTEFSLKPRPDETKKVGERFYLEFQLEKEEKTRNRNIELGVISIIIGTSSSLYIYPKALEQNDIAMATIGGIIAAVCYIGCGYFLSQYEKNEEKIKELEEMYEECQGVKRVKKPRRLGSK